MHPHLQALIDALSRELRAQEEEHAQLRALPLPERAAAGFSLYPLEISATEHRSRGRVHVLLRGRDLGEAFSPGDPILLAPLGKPDEGIVGRIEGIDETVVELRVEGAPEGSGPWVVSRRFDPALQKAQQEVLRRAEDRYKPLVNLLLGREMPYKADPYDHPAFARLHPSQRAAAALALGCTEIGLVHGPPGTGKTEVLVAILAALRDLGERPWALADSNAAVDHLAARASAAGLNVVRLGVSARIGGPVKQLTLEHRILHGSRAGVIHRLMREATRADGDELFAIRGAIREEWSAAKREVLLSADVLAMTIGTLQTRGEDLTPPRTAVLDEAGQIAEPALWLVAQRVKRLILTGDPHQLGPVIKGRDKTLERSLLQRLVDEGFQFPMLTQQRRMNTTLMALCQPTYGGRLSAAPDVAEAALTLDSAWATPAARFIDTAGMGHDEEPDAVGSFANPGEVELLARVWRDLKAAGLRPERVGVIAPYRAQVVALRKALPELEVGTVNAFQGRERDVILASFVRSNVDGTLGFVADPRRLNVTLTRARLLFIGVGDSATLGGWAPFAAFLEAVGEGYTSGWDLA